MKIPFTNREIHIVRNSVANSTYYDRGNYFGITACLIGDVQFAGAILTQMFNKIFGAFSAVVFTNNGGKKQKLAQKIANIYQTRFNEIYYRLFEYGVCVFAFSKDDFIIVPINDYSIATATSAPKPIDTKKYAGYELIAMYSTWYDLKQTPDRIILDTQIKLMNNTLNAIYSTTENLGALGVLSPQTTNTGVGLNDLTKDEQEEIQNKWGKTYGLGVGKFKILITPKPMQWTQINLPIKDLMLNDTLKMCIEILGGYFGIPKELLPTTDNGTFANREGARNELWENTIASWANKLMEFANNNILTISGTLLDWEYETIKKIQVDETTTQTTATEVKNKIGY